MTAPTVEELPALPTFPSGPGLPDQPGVFIPQFLAFLAVLQRWPGELNALVAYLEGLSTTTTTTIINEASIANGMFGETDVPHGYSLTKRGVIIQRGTAGSWKEARVESPMVFWDPKIGKYRMVYYGCAGAPGAETYGSLGYATSSDLETWTEYASNPFFQKSGVSGDPDENGAAGPFVWYEDGTYYLFYMGKTTTGFGGDRICLATSTDFATWTRYGAMITAKASTWRATGVFHPCVVKRGDTYYLFFNAMSGSNSDQTKIGYATATDLNGPWTVDDGNSPVLDVGTSGAWDDFGVGDPCVYRVGETWYMAFCGHDGTSWQDGIATTSDADFPLGWSKYANNPVLTVGTAGSFDDTDAGRPAIWVTPTRYYHWYSTSDGSTPELVEIAMAFQDLLGLTGVTAGSYTLANITVDAGGRVTAASSGSITDLGVFHAYEEQPSGTAGGGSTAGTWAKRVLNTTKLNSITGASLASNEITLPAGTYDINASAPTYDDTTFGSAIRLFNVTDSTTILLGSSQWTTANGEVRCFVQGRFTLAAQKNVAIYSWHSNTQASNGLGVNAGLAGSVANHFTDIFVRKVS